MLSIERIKLTFKRLAWLSVCINAISNIKYAGIRLSHAILSDNWTIGEEKLNSYSLFIICHKFQILFCSFLLFQLQLTYSKSKAWVTAGFTWIGFSFIRSRSISRSRPWWLIVFLSSTSPRKYSMYVCKRTFVGEGVLHFEKERKPPLQKGW